MTIDPDLTRVVVSDVHGNYEALRKVLQYVGALNSRNERPEGFYIVQLGDLINMTESRRAGDLVTLQFAERNIDIVLCGNHELWYAWKLYSGVFGGMTKAPEVEIMKTINRMVRNGQFLPTTAVDGWLISHAGVHRIYQMSLVAEAETASKVINERFEKRITTKKEDPLFDSIGVIRSLGRADRPGGLFWCDVTELAMAGNRIKQIVGHTPLSVRVPLQLSENLWTIDPGTFGVSVLVKKSYQTRWIATTARTRIVEAGSRVDVRAKV